MVAITTKGLRAFRAMTGEGDLEVKKVAGTGVVDKLDESIFDDLPVEQVAQEVYLGILSAMQLSTNEASNPLLKSHLDALESRFPAIKKFVERSLEQTLSDNRKCLADLLSVYAKFRGTEKVDTVSE